MVGLAGLDCNQALRGRLPITQVVAQVLIKKIQAQPYLEDWEAVVIHQHSQLQERVERILVAVEAQGVTLPLEVLEPMEVLGLSSLLIQILILSCHLLTLD
jgi:hypothetical protein